MSVGRNSAFGDGRAREGGPFRSYAATLREHIRFILAALVVGLVAAGAVVATSPTRYTAHADMLITPVPATETTVLGLGLLRQATDPSGGLSTAATLIDNAEVATQAQRNLRLAGSPESLLSTISVAPVASSSIVEITATAPSAAQAQRRANAFAQAAVEVRTSALHRALAPAITSLRAQIKSVGAGNGNGNGNGNAANLAGAQPLYQQLVLLESLASAPDPTIQFETPAALPTAPSSPKTKLVLVAGLIGGLLIGIAGAFILKALAPRRTREGELELTGLSVLTRVPTLGRGVRMRDAFDESFRSLRTMLRFAADDGAITTIAVTSPSEQEGKTTTSFQLAMASLEAGQRVLLIEADPFRPGLRHLVEHEDRGGPGLVEYFSGGADLDDVVLDTSLPGLRFIHSGSGVPTGITRLLESERGRSLSTAVAGLADIIILDCPPVGPRSDAILIASAVDAVLIVIDLEHSNERDVFETVQRLRRAGANLLGLVLNRDNTMIQSYEHRAADAGPGGGGRSSSPRQFTEGRRSRAEDKLRSRN